MDLRPIDVMDDATINDLYDVERRSDLLGREHMPFWPREEFIGAIRSKDVGERQEVVGAYVDGRLVGSTTTWFPLLDNVEKCWGEVHVDPDHQRRGIGRALLADVERRAAADNRTMVLSQAKLPFDDRETHGYRRFAEANGYQLANYEVVRHLAMPVPDERIQAWMDEAAPAHEGYTFETFVDNVPEDLIESLCVLLGQLAVDAPTGAVDFEEEAVTPERYADLVATTQAMGRARYETVALTPDRQVVAQTTLALPLKDSTRVYQWGTFVHREHRGHRLGLAVKALNLRAVQQARPDLTLATTQNGETNDYMVSINVKMGFEPVEISAEFFRNL